MKQALITLLESTLSSLVEAGTLSAMPEKINIERTRDKAHGDFASNIAMVLCKQAGMKPRDLATIIVDALPEGGIITKVEIAGPGFINFTLTSDAQHAVIGEVLQQAEQYGHCNAGEGQKVQIEFVSANPTGPLHVGHGRGAAYGSSLANLMRTAGYNVHCEYYVNDAGRQMDILAASVWLRYLNLAGEPTDDITTDAFPNNGYQGDYVWDIAASLHREFGDRFRHPITTVMADTFPDEGEDGGDKERHVDDIINKAKSLLGDSDYRVMFDAGATEITDNIRRDLGEFGVEFDEWFSERSLADSGAIDSAIAKLQDAGHLYEKNGAIWFKTTDLGDEKDRVVVRDNGLKTYFASDIAYHMQKFERGYDSVIDVWGSDHHGYIARVRAALKAMSLDDSKLQVLLVQFAILYRGKEKLKMSTRSGQFVTLRELRNEVGNDAARFFYVMRKCEQHMDFDLELAKSKSNENPVYYVQYAHARICRVFSQLTDQGLSWDQAHGLSTLDVLVEEHETDLMTLLARYPELVGSSARAREPHHIAYYLRDLATVFNAYYHAHKFIVEDAKQRDARLSLITAVRQVLRNGLQLLGVNAPDTM